MYVMKSFRCILFAFALVSVPNALLADAMKSIRERVESIVVSRIEMRDVPANDALARIVRIYTEQAPKRPLRFRFVDDPLHLPGFKPLEHPEPQGGRKPASERPFTANITNIPLSELLYYFARSVNCNLTLKGDEILLYPDVGTVEPLVTKTYQNGPPLGVNIAPEDVAGHEKVDIRKQLATKGVRFFRGGFADFYPGDRRLVIRTTDEEHFNFRIKFVPD